MAYSRRNHGDKTLELPAQFHGDLLEILDNRVPYRATTVNEGMIALRGSLPKNMVACLRRLNSTYKIAQHLTSAFLNDTLRELDSCLGPTASSAKVPSPHTLKYERVDDIDVESPMPPSAPTSTPTSATSSAVSSGATSVSTNSATTSSSPTLAPSFAPFSATPAVPTSSTTTNNSSPSLLRLDHVDFKLDQILSQVEVATAGMVSLANREMVGLPLSSPLVCAMSCIAAPCNSHAWPPPPIYDMSVDNDDDKLLQAFREGEIADEGLMAVVRAVAMDACTQTEDELLMPMVAWVVDSEVQAAIAPRIARFAALA